MRMLDRIADRKWAGLISMALASCLVGCEAPRPIMKYPPGSLRVRYEEATTHSTCLVAGVAMAANYLLDKYRFSTDGIVRELKQAGLDETRIGDLKKYLQSQGLYLVTLQGQMDAKPPAGLRYWLQQRGYPVICVINREGDDPAFNHAVVVIGISPNPEPPSTDSIDYFDPSSDKPLHSADAAAFEVLWSRASHAMMIVVSPAGRPASGSMPAAGPAGALQGVANES